MYPGCSEVRHKKSHLETLILAKGRFSHYPSLLSPAVSERESSVQLNRSVLRGINQSRKLYPLSPPDSADRPPRLKLISMIRFSPVWEFIKEAFNIGLIFIEPGVDCTVKIRESYIKFFTCISQARDIIRPILLNYVFFYFSLSNQVLKVIFPAIAFVVNKIVEKHSDFFRSFHHQKHIFTVRDNAVRLNFFSHPTGFA